MLFKIFFFCVSCSVFFVVAVKPKFNKLEKRLELEGIYRIQNPDENSVVTVEEAAENGKPPLKLVSLQPLREDDDIPEQHWSIMTSGPPVARVAAIFNQKEVLNVLTNEYGFVGTTFTRAWQVLDVGSGLAVFRNLGLCLTRLEEATKVDRSDCSNGKNVTAAQKWKVVFVKELPTTNEARSSSSLI